MLERYEQSPGYKRAVSEFKVQPQTNLEQRDWLNSLYDDGQPPRVHQIRGMFDFTVEFV